MKLSKNFWLNEFTKSGVAARKGISNKPTPQVTENLTLLCKNILQVVRYAFGAVTINSGYRSRQLNKSIGGSIHSQHCKGEATDFEVQSEDYYEVAEWIRQNLEFDQLILEFYDEDDPNSGWIHVSYRKGKNRKQVLRAVRVKGKTKYLPGLTETGFSLW